MLSEGEFIYLLDDRERRSWLQLRGEMVKVQGLGVVDGSKIVGRPDGSLIKLAGKDFRAFRATVVQLMESLERGPQIITPKDAATIVFQLGLRAGETVLEAGVGSAGLTMALLNAVMPSGKVISVEVREDFAQRARRNVERAGLAPYWDLRVGDVKTIELGTEVDAVALDMPDPWLALDNVDRFLRPGGRFAGFVPNTNQVEGLVNGLRERGYLEVRAYENIQRSIDVHPGGVRPSYDNLAHTGYLVFGRRPARE
ncbi:MAG: tRNA (adenine-N1)-methyltransferase [Methanomassiliicoccus sp.]|nr:tRNA (adenine-N1)-methyltransferase [Methanomassiliicoccus sp.]